MFDVAPTELMLVALVALVVIGPKDLPRLMRVVGQWVARARGMARHFRSGMDEMIRQAEIEEMERKWAEENARIMREHPTSPEEISQEDDAAAATQVADMPETEPPYSEIPAPEQPASDHESEAPVPSPQAELPFGGARTADRPA